MAIEVKDKLEAAIIACAKKTKELLEAFCEANEFPVVTDNWPNNLIHPTG